MRIFSLSFARFNNLLLLLCVYNFVVDIFCDVVGWSVGLLLLILFQLVFLYTDILNRTKRENL